MADERAVLSFLELPYTPDCSDHLKFVNVNLFNASNLHMVFYQCINTTPKVSMLSITDLYISVIQCDEYVAA